MVRWPFLLMLVKQDLRTCDGKNNFKHNKNKFKSTFFPRTIVDWNELPEKTDELSLGSRIDGHLQSSRCAWVLALYPVYRPSTESTKFTIARLSLLYKTINGAVAFPIDAG